MKKPLTYRGAIPLYFEKSAEMYRFDKYENYDVQVLRNCHLHLGSEFSDPCIEFLKELLIYGNPAKHIAEIGCGIAYHTSELASQFQECDFIALDSSYQMLKMASELWKNEDDRKHIFKARANGQAEFEFVPRNLDNLSLGMSRAADTPLQTGSQDITFSIALWDRLLDPLRFIQEMSRILKPRGTLAIVSPFNYQKNKLWEDWYPLDKVIQKVESVGFEFSKQENWNADELLDIQGNFIRWKYRGLIFTKKKM